MKENEKNKKEVMMAVLVRSSQTILDEGDKIKRLLKEMKSHSNSFLSREELDKLIYGYTTNPLLCELRLLLVDKMNYAGKNLTDEELGDELCNIFHVQTNSKLLDSIVQIKLNSDTELESVPEVVQFMREDIMTRTQHFEAELDTVKMLSESDRKKLNDMQDALDFLKQLTESNVNIAGAVNLSMETVNLYYQINSVFKESQKLSLLANSVLWKRSGVSTDAQLQAENVIQVSPQLK